MARKTLLTNTPRNLAKKYLQELTKAGIKVNQLIIFGSYAKGNYKYYSDLDICVVSPQFGKNRFNERLMLKRISNKVDDMIEPHPYHPKDLKEKWDPLAEQIRSTGKTIYIQNI